MGLNGGCIYPADHSATFIMPIFRFFGEDLDHPYRQHRHHQMSPKVLTSTSRAKNESWSECSDHISATAADSNFVAGPPIQVPVIARWKMLSRVS